MKTEFPTHDDRVHANREDRYRSAQDFFRSQGECAALERDPDGNVFALCANRICRKHGDPRAVFFQNF